MPTFKITSLGLLCLFASLALGSKCPQDSISKLIVCYYQGDIPLTNFNICNCTHVVFTNSVKRAENNRISSTEDTIKYLDLIKEKKENLSAIFTLETKQDDTSTILKSENRTEDLINGIVEFLQESQFDGVELNFKFGSDDGVSKESYASFVKKLSKTLSHHRRVKREGYDVSEKLQDDITTASYTTQTPKNSTTKTQSIKQRNGKPNESNRKVREEKNEDEDDTDYLTLEEAINMEFSRDNSEDQVTLKDVEQDTVEEKFLIFVRLSIKPEIIAKKYDLKALSRYADILTVPTHDIVSTNEERLTYHPSRLMGLSDILNTDSILDFLTGMGAMKSKMVINLPATVLKFQLKDENKNTPRSPSRSKPQVIDQSQLCALFNKHNWTVERDDDLTAPYAYSGKIWLAFEDEISTNIKGKYILLRELAGGGIYPIDSDVNDGLCTNRTGSGGYLTGILHKNFERLERKPRALVLETLQNEIHENAFTNVEAGVKVSEYRIVRVVDHSGAVHIIRKNTKTQFECSRQGYFSHPLGCNKFYRCVKFNQYSDEFTVFEYDCPAGLAFDERWEVCVWPGSLPHGAPCTGSSEIAPVPRSHYQCPSHEGYYADPENCRWFFACLDHARDGITPLTAYEFRCPFGLVFSETKLACDWPWLVGGCGNRGAAGYLQVSAAGQGIHTATFINGGNLEASLGQYGNTDQEASFVGFGKKFGSGLKASKGFKTETSYQGAQSAGFGYIAGQFDDHHNRAPFAAFPDYEISGGRILNKGGVVLDQNIAGISGVEAEVVAGGVGNTASTGSAGSYLGSASGGNYVGFEGAGRHEVIGSTGNIAGTGGAGSLLSAGKIVGAGSYTGSEISGSTAGAGNYVGISGIERHVGAEGAGSSIGIGGTGNTASSGGAGSLLSAGKIVGAGSYTGSEISGSTAGAGNYVGISGIGSHVGAGSSIGIGGTGNIASTGGTGNIASTGGAGSLLSTGKIVGVGSAGSYTGSEISGSIAGAGNYVGITGIGSHVGAGGVGNYVTTGGNAAGTGAGAGISGDFRSDSALRSFGKTSGYFEKPTQKTSKSNNFEITGIYPGQVSLENPISTPKPFSVNIPSVQINAEKTFQFSEHSAVGSTTPQTLIFKETPQTENIHVTGQRVSHGFTASQPTVSVGAPIVTPTTETFALGGVQSGSSHLKTDISVGSFSATPKTEVHRFGQFKQSEFLGKISGNQASVAVGVPAVTGTTFGHSSIAAASITPTLPVSDSVPLVTPKPGIHTFEHTASHGGGVGSSLPTATPPTSFTQQNYKLTDHGSSLASTFGKVDLTVQTNLFKNVNEGQNFASGNVRQAGVSFGDSLVTVTPSYNGVKTGSESTIHLSGVSGGPALTDFVQTTLDKKVSNELKFNKPQTSYAVPTVTEFHSIPTAAAGQLNVNSHITNNIPVVTPKPYHQATVTGKSPVSYDVPAVTPQSDLNAFKYYEKYVGVTPVVPFQPSAATISSTFGQTKNAEDISKVSFNVPAAAHFESAFQEKGISQTEKTFVAQGIQTGSIQTGVSHAPQANVPIRPAFGERYSSFKQSGHIQPFGPASEIVKPNILTEVSIEQQPIAIVGSTDSDITLSTPRTYSSSQSVFSQSPAVHNVNLKSTYIQPQQGTVTTPAPVVSITPSTPHALNLNVIAKSPQTITYKHEERINVGTSTPAAIFNGKSSTFEQEIRSFTPAVQVSTPVPITYNHDVSSAKSAKPFFEKNYLSPVTTKAEIFGPTIQYNSQGSAGQFGTTERNQILIQPKQSVVNQQFEFVKTKPLIEERRTEFIQHQVPLQVNTAEQEYRQDLKIEQPLLATGKLSEPREQLVELEISKSVELNPAQFIKSRGYASAHLPAQEIEIQQQPVHLVSQKTFSAKQVIQPFYKQEKEIVHTQINNIPQDNQEQFVFQQPINFKTPKPDKQYLPVTTSPPLSYTTAKTIKIDQPLVYSGEPAPVLPAFEASRVPLSQKETVISKTSTYRPAFFEPQPSKVNLLLPVTESNQFVPSQTEELTIQTHANFDSRKISKFGSTPAQNVFIQTTLKPAVNVYETLQYSTANSTTRQSGFASGFKYPTNPKIDIPEPPREYILAQNAYTTVAPDRVLGGGGFVSTESIANGYKSSTYLPPSRKKSSKTTIISVGSSDEDIRDDNIHQLLDKYSGRFGEVVNGRNENVVTKVIKGEGSGRIEVDRQGSSTVRYEVSTTSRPRSRGRQYHGGLTSGIQAANKYEEYEIDGGSQRSFAVGKDDGDASKTTIDLKNLKLDKNKKTVIVVSQVSDANPVLIGKLAGQCSCQSNMIQLRGKGTNSKGVLRGNKENQRQHSFITNEYLPPFESNQENFAGGSLTQGQASTASPEIVVIDGSKGSGLSYQSEQTLISSTTVNPEISPSTLLSSLGPDGVLSITPKTPYERRNKKKHFRGRSRYLPPASSLTQDGLPLLSPIPASEIASTFDYNVLKGDESRTQNEIDGGASKTAAGAAYERYGPGGWRSFDETLQGSIDCKRPGLFRHPKHCNKFYACNYDPWKERYTLHIFNCPIHLTYDSSISACNWPVRGPACADDNLLV